MNHLFRSDSNYNNSPPSSASPSSNGNSGSSSNSNGTGSGNSNSNNDFGDNFRPQSSDYGQQQPFPFQQPSYLSLNQQQYQQQQQQQQHQHQPQHGHAPPENYRPVVSDSYNGYSTHAAHRPPSEYIGQEGPTRSHRRGMSSENNRSVRFNPSRNYGADSSERGTFLSGPKIPGLPCIACSMSRAPCDGGSPCRPCTLNRLRCHYEGDNNTRFFGIDALQLDQPLSLQQHQLQHDNRDNPDNHPPRLGSADPSTSSSHPSRSRSRSDSGSASGSGSSLDPRSVLEHSCPRVSPLISSPITLSDQSLISIPPFQEPTNQDRPQNSKALLPSISSIVPLSSASIFSSNLRPSAASKTTISSSSSSRTKSNENGDGMRPILPVQRLSVTRMTTLSNERAGSSQPGSSAGVDPVVRRPSTKKQLLQQTQVPKDPLYSLSSASIRARKNALEMENIQRASNLYADYIAKIKALSVPTTADTDIANKITTTHLSENEQSPFSRMEVDMEDPVSSDQTNDADSPPARPTCAKGSARVRLSPTPKVSSDGSAISEKEHDCLEGLKRILKSGLLHSLIEQYFTLIHPQFTILHKNQFLVRFWMQYGPFPESNGVMEMLQNTSPEMPKKGPTEPLQSTSTKDGESRRSQKVSPLLLIAMLALVSRHINDRTPLGSAAADRHRIIRKQLALVGAMNIFQEKAQERFLEQLMGVDEKGQSLGENFKDRGEQYFQWASELLKHEYEEPSLIVVQSLLLLREYAIMAGNHTQAYMYGGTAITMAMGLGWHHAHLMQASQRDDNIDVSVSEKGPGEGAETERRKETRVKDEEQKLCWWHCFIVDRWMSAAYNRPVNIPVHIFDKTHLQPLPKEMKNLQTSISEQIRSSMSVLSSNFWLFLETPENHVPLPSLVSSSELDAVSFGASEPSSESPNIPGVLFRAKAFFNQQCRQALLLDDILCFLSSWSDDLFVGSTEFEKLSNALDDWHRSLANWQTFPLSGIVSPPAFGSRNKGQKSANSNNHDINNNSNTNAEEGRDIVQSTLLGITFHTIRILLYRPFLRTNLRHPPCLPARASAVCAQSANAMTSLAEYLMNQTDPMIQPCLLMRHQFCLVTAAGIQLMNANLDDEPRLSTPAKINLLKTIRVLRDADRSSWGAGVRDGFHQVLRELFPAQMKQMYDGR